MYTRRRPYTPPTPPPDYSGTAIPPPSPQTEEDARTLLPPPPALPSRRMPQEAEAEARRLVYEDREGNEEREDNAESGGKEADGDAQARAERRTRRPDLAAPPPPRPTRNLRLLRRGTARAPMQEGSARAGANSLPAMGKGEGQTPSSLLAGFSADDLLLLGLIALFLWGGEDGVEHPDILLMLGLLFFIGKSS